MRDIDTSVTILQMGTIVNERREQGTRKQEYKKYENEDYNEHWATEK